MPSPYLNALVGWSILYNLGSTVNILQKLICSFHLSYQLWLVFHSVKQQLIYFSISFWFKLRKPTLDRLIVSNWCTYIVTVPCEINYLAIDVWSPHLSAIVIWPSPVYIWTSIMSHHIIHHVIQCSCRYPLSTIAYIMCRIIFLIGYQRYWPWSCCNSTAYEQSNIHMYYPLTLTIPSKEVKPWARNASTYFSCLEQWPTNF
jgi:hypothetical protein